MKKIALLFVFLLVGMSLIAKSVDEKRVENIPISFKDRINLMGYAQIGYTSTDEKDVELNNNFDIKRIIFMVDGKLSDKWRVFFMSNLNKNATLLEIYTEYTLYPQLKIRLGQFKIPFGIENQMSPTVVELIDVYSLSTRKMICSDPTTGSTAGRDIGMMLHGTIIPEYLKYKLAIINGQGINTDDVNNAKDFVACLDYMPIKGLLLNMSAYYGTACAIEGQDCFDGRIHKEDDYSRQRYSVGLRYITPYFSIRSEYIHGKDENLKSDGYYVTGSVNMNKDIQMIASYDSFIPSKKLANQSNIYSIGVQYWFYPRCRLQLNYVYQDTQFVDDIQKIQAQVQVRF